MGVVSFAQPQSGFSARSGFYGPRSAQKYARPTLRWEVWSDNGPVTSADMRVNGHKVDAKYDPASRSLEYTPSQPLSPGTAKVQCSVTFMDSYTFTRDWETPIVAGAVPSLPAANNEQMAALANANRLRSALALPPMVLDDRMNAAAQAHADYMMQNNAHGHNELSDRPGFCGEEVSDRLEAFGWGGPVWEGLTYGKPSPAISIRELFDAPYHRIPFLQPGTPQFGYGVNTGNAAAEVQDNKVSGVVVSPADGQEDVPSIWYCHESPSPLATHPETNPNQPVGYPIVLAEFGAGMAKIHVNSAQLLDSAGNPLPAMINTPENDPNLINALTIIPLAPLQDGGFYKVVVSAIGGRGTPIEKTWSFRTQIQVLMTHGD